MAIKYGKTRINHFESLSKFSVFRIEEIIRFMGETQTNRTYPLYWCVIRILDKTNEVRLGFYRKLRAEK